MELPEHHAAAPLSVDALLEQAVALGASDLHLTAGRSRPSACTATSSSSSEYPVLDPDLDPRSSSTGSRRPSSRRTSSSSRQLDFAYGLRGIARFRVNAYYQRESLAAAFRMIPTEIQSLEELGLPVEPARADEEPARPRARHRPDRLR